MNSSIPATAYIPASTGFAISPLQRFLPPFPKNMMKEWLQKNIPPGTWIIDPLGANAWLDIEAAQSGYRILTLRSNPIIRLLLEAMANPPSSDQLCSMLTPLMTSTHGGVKLEDYLQSLYITRCPSCKKLIQTKGYVWIRGEKQPHWRVITCQYCGAEGEYSLTEDDSLQFDLINKNDKLHRSRARTRVALGLSEVFPGFLEALDCYLSRPLYIIITLINKLEILSPPAKQRIILLALMLELFDYGNSLWPWPLKSYRPITLTTPAQFFEHNLWLELQNSMSTWTHLDTRVSVSRWPEFPPESGGICLYQKKDLDSPDFVTRSQPKAALIIFPYPNQAFMTFSSLWSGWLWGYQAVKHVRSGLARQRYDWHWYAGALHTSLKPLHNILPDSCPIFGMAPESTPANLYAITATAKSNLWELKGLAYRFEDKLFQMHWNKGEKSIQNPNEPTISDYRLAIEELIKQRGEPVSYEELLNICLLTRALRMGLPSDLQALREDELRPIMDTLKQLIQDAYFLKTYKYPHQSNLNQWWLSQSTGVEAPLSERVESEIYTILQKRFIKMQDAENLICQKFLGFLTPAREFIETCLNSYSDGSDENRYYHLREEDKPEKRREDLTQMTVLLSEMAKRIGFTSNKENPISWKNKSGEVQYQFFLLTTAGISQILFGTHELPPEKCILVIPGSRSRLIVLRQRQDARLHEALDEGWRFLKFRHLRRLAQKDNLSFSLWEELLNSDPVLWDAPVQLPIL